MSDAQRKWWEKKGAKKFSDVCYDSAKATVKIVWWRDVVNESHVIKNTADSRFDLSVNKKKDIGYGFVKLLAAPDAEKTLFFVDRDERGTVHVLERAVEFLVHRSAGEQR